MRDLSLSAGIGGRVRLSQEVVTPGSRPRSNGPKFRGKTVSNLSTGTCLMSWKDTESKVKTFLTPYNSASKLLNHIHFEYLVVDGYS